MTVPPKYLAGRLNGGWLRSQREQAGLTRKAMAELIDRTPSFVQAIEDGFRACPWFIREAYEVLREK